MTAARALWPDLPWDDPAALVGPLLGTAVAVGSVAVGLPGPIRGEAGGEIARLKQVQETQALRIAALLDEARLRSLLWPAAAAMALGAARIGRPTFERDLLPVMTLWASARQLDVPSFIGAFGRDVPDTLEALDNDEGPTHD